MRTPCVRCGGFVEWDVPHVCDGREVELGQAMDRAELERAAEKLDHAAFFLSTQTIPANTPAWREGYEFAIRSLRQEASDIRDGARKP